MHIARVALGPLLVICMPAAPAAAQDALVPAPTTVTWVSSSGNDNNRCDFAAPCRTFIGAMDKARAGGVIACRDSGFFGGGAHNGFFRITKSITIDCTGHSAQLDNIIVDGFSPIDGRRLPGAENFVVILRGLSFHGGAATVAVNALRAGIAFQFGKALHVENCRIAGYSNSSQAIAGIRFEPEGNSRLHVTDSTITGNGNSTQDAEKIGAGILVKPFGAGSARVVLTRVNAHQNSIGISADATNSVGGIAMTVIDSVSASNDRDGFLAISTRDNAPIRVLLDRVRALNNDTNGIRASGPTAVVRVANSVISGNDKAVSAEAGGAVQTAGSNIVEGNRLPGAFTAKVTPK